MNEATELDDQSRRDELEAEMSRFEQEIAEHPISRPVIATNTFNMAAKAIQNSVILPETRPTQLPEASRSAFIPRSVTQPPIAPRPMSQPPNLRHPNLHAGPANPLPLNSRPRQPHMQPVQLPMQHNLHVPPNQLPPPPIPPSMPLVNGMPHMAHQMAPNRGVLPVMAPVGIPMVPVPVPMGMPTMQAATPTVVPTMTAEEQREWESTYSQGATEGREKKKPKEKKFIRVAGDTVWEDNSLAEWDTDDFRVFCGDLGNEVTDESLTRAFAKYPSLLKAKVVRDKKTNKSKGFGFLSFKDPNDFVKAMREMNGKYIGNRPIKLRKSTWKDRNIEVVKKKQKEKKRLGYR